MTAASSGLASAQGLLERMPLWSHRSLIWNFAKRDLKSRFKGTALGWAWSWAVPLSILAIYTLVFSVIFRAAPPALGNGHPGNFTLFLLAGLVPWGGFANTLNLAIATLLSAGPLMKKIYFPAYAPVFGSVMSAMTQVAIELGVLLVVLLALGNIGLTWLLVPLWVLLFVVFVSGLCVVLSILNVYYRDLAHLISVALQLLFYLTPIIYQLSFLPSTWHGMPLRTIIATNPIAQFVQVFRALVYDLQPGALHNWAYLLAWCGISTALAVVVYRRRGLDLGEEL